MRYLLITIYIVCVFSPVPAYAAECNTERYYAPDFPVVLDNPQTLKFVDSSFSGSSLTVGWAMLLDVDGGYDWKYSTLNDGATVSFGDVVQRVVLIPQGFGVDWVDLEWCASSATDYKKGFALPQLTYEHIGTILGMLIMLSLVMGFSQFASVKIVYG
ncbi:MAG: hypothetical protein ACLFVO_27135, partial [Chloroflexaceae bacterium]